MAPVGERPSPKAARNKAPAASTGSTTQNASIQNVLFTMKSPHFAIKRIILPAMVAMVGWTLITGLTGEPWFLGSQWLASHWMFLHSAVGVLLLIPLALSWQPRNPDWLLAMQVCCYTFHQLEEHGYDIYGQRYSFIKHLGSMVGCNDMKVTTLENGNLDVSGCPGLSPSLILYINVYAVFGLFAGSLFFVPRVYRPFMACLMLSLALYNALIFHVIAGAAKGFHYNPGMAQSLLINIPFGVYGLKKLYDDELVTKKDLLVGFLVCGFPGQPLLLMAPVMLGVKGVVGPYVVHLILLLLLSPLFFGYKIAAKLGVHEPTDRAKKLGEGTPLLDRDSQSAEPLWTVEKGWAQV